MPPVALTASVVKRERQTGLRLACEALEGVAEDPRANDDGDAREANAGAKRTANETLLEELRGAGGEMAIVGFWESRDAFDPLAALHFLARSSGGAPSFRCAPCATCEEEERRAIEELHAEMTRENKSAVVQMKDGEGRTSGELHLVAVPEATREGEEDGGEGTGDERRADGGASATTRFVAFKTDEMAPAYAQPLLKHNRLVVVFDLDETLVQSTTLHMLDRRIEATRLKMVSLMKFDVTNPRVSTVMIEEVKQDKIACEQALRRLQTDRAMLYQYCSEGAVTHNNRRSVTIPEIESLPNGMQRLRNIIRIPSPHIKGAMLVFTVINPANPATAMLVHVRPGWEEMRKYLAGSDGRQSKRAEVFVCTKASNNYAREVCRILDPHGAVFEPAQLEHRVKSVGVDEMKSLRTTCGAHFPAELTVIVDDRTVVWEAEAQSHILAVTPFMPYGTDVDFGSGIEQHEAGGTGGVLGTVQSMLETLRLRWHMDYGKFAIKARKHLQETAAHGALRPTKDSSEGDSITSKDENESDDAATESDVLLRAEHHRKKAERLFYPPNAGDLLKPLMDMQAKEAALGIAERGGAARAAAGSGSRLAAALGVLDRQNNAKQQHAKFKAKADTDADADANVEDSSEAPKEGVEIKRESEEDEIKPKFRHIDISALEGRKGDDTNECQENLPRKERRSEETPAARSPSSGKKRSREADVSDSSDSNAGSEPESESEPDEDEDEDEDDDTNADATMNADPEEAEDEAVDPRRAWEKKQVGELKLELKCHGLPTKGRKADLIERLDAHRHADHAFKDEKGKPKAKSVKNSTPKKVFREGTRGSTRGSASEERFKL